MVIEGNTGVTTQLNSSSNTHPGNFNWQGWACGNNGVIIKSVAGYPAQQWVNYTGHGVPTNINLNNICAASDQIAFVTGTLGSTTFVWKTSNGGNNWFQVFSQTNGFINAVWMKNTALGIMIGNPVSGRWSIWKTNNGGLNWDSTALYLAQSNNESGFPNSLCMELRIQNTEDTNKIWFGTNNYRIYYSSNYGQSWISETTGTEQNSYCIAYSTKLYVDAALYVGGINRILRSTNSGLNFTYDSIPGPGNICGITFCEYYPVAVKSNKLYTKMTGWFNIYSTPSGNYTYIDNRGRRGWIDHYAVKNNGGVTFATQGEGIQKTGSQIPSSFHVYDAYPNPFNPAVKIKFDIAIKNYVKTDIYDINGKLIQNIFNNELTPAQYEIEWNASAYSSGIYFCKITSGGFTDIKKLVLVK